MSEYYTVTQYAQLMHKDTGNIRKILINGLLEGEKVGNQWLIPKTAEYPEDKRVKSGNYRNWRKRSEIWRNHPELMKNVLAMCGKINGVYGDIIDKIVLYGSYARGDETAESDMDIALILKDGETNDMHDALTEIVVDYELECGIVLSVVTIEDTNYREWRRVLPYYKNLDKEGILLWKR